LILNIKYLTVLTMLRLGFLLPALPFAPSTPICLSNVSLASIILQ